MTKRPETGPMVFKDDWSGVFIRGDDCAYYISQLKMILLRTNDKAVIERIEEIIVLLESAFDKNGIQKLKTFNECKL